MATETSLQAFVSEEQTTPPPDAAVNPVTSVNQNLPAIRRTLEELGLSDDHFGLRLKLWKAPLECVAHLEGQFVNVTKHKGLGRTAEAVEDKIAQQELVKDLRLLRDLSAALRGALYSGKSSESGFSVIPVLFEAPDNGSPLNPAAFWKALRIDSQLARKFPDPRLFSTKDDFLRYMEVEHLKLDDPQYTDDEDRQILYKAAKALAAYAEPPFVELIVGQEELYNPIPIFWLGTSPASGCILGLMSALVWT